MALDDRLRPSVDAALDELTARVSQDVRALVEELTKVALAERDEALTAQREVDAAAARADVQRQVEEAEARGRAREREAEIAALTRLLDSIRSLESVTTLTDVLDALARAASREASRAAVLVVRHDRLVGWKAMGFGAADAQPKAIDVGLTENSVASVAVKTARPVTTREVGAERLTFAHLPADRMGLAVPVIVGGRAVAVVYADSGALDGLEPQTPSYWPELIEILARHASRCLEALTVQKSAVSPAPRFWVQPASRPGISA